MRKVVNCITWYIGKDISQGNLTTERKITQLALQKCKLPLATENTLLFFHMECLPFYSAKPNITCNQIISLLEPNINIVNPNFLYYSLLANKNRLRKLRTGTAQKFTKQTQLITFTIPLPPIPQQKQILQKFSIVYNTLFKSEVVYNDFLLKMMKKYLELGDLLFLKYKDSEIRVKDKFKLVAGKTPPSSNSPLQKKKIPLEVVRNYPHLRAKTNYFLTLFRLRHSISKTIHDFFHQAGFYYVPTPIITSNDTEGAGETFNITTNQKEPFFSKTAKLTVSGQLQAEALVQGLGKVYTFGPCFRAEKSHTTRHLAEFWMVEPEMAFADLETIISLAEKMVKYVINYVLNHNSTELRFLENYDKENKKEIINKLEKIAGEKFEFKKIDYVQAIEILKEKKKDFVFSDIKWGMDLQSEHEKYLCQHFDNSPVFITNYPASLKAFYMKNNKALSGTKNNSDGRTVACFDLLFPEIGELIGGSVREDNYNVLLEKAQKIGLEINNLSWYFDLRKYGYAPSAGFGLGLERLIMFISGTENIRDTIAFPRFPGKLEF